MDRIVYSALYAFVLSCVCYADYYGFVYFAL